MSNVQVFDAILRALFTNIDVDIADVRIKVNVPMLRLQVIMVVVAGSTHAFLMIASSVALQTTLTRMLAKQVFFVQPSDCGARRVESMVSAISAVHQGPDAAAL